MAVSPDWYREYFREPYGEIYEDYLLPPEVARQEAQFACDALGLKPGARVFDCPCGFGRHLEVLHPLFPDIVGLDLVNDCIDRARELLPGAQLVQGDMRTLPIRPGAFDAILVLFNSFGYFGEDDNRAVLREFARVLKPGGQMLLDLANIPPLLAIIRDHPQTTLQVEDVTIHEEWQYDQDSGRLHNQTAFEMDGETTRRSYTVRLYSHDEVLSLLGEAGFHVEKTRGDFDDEDFNPDDSPRLILVARRGDA